jgi:hypothetical protein
MKGSATAAKGNKEAQAGSGKEKFPPAEKGAVSKNKGGGSKGGKTKKGYGGY